MRHIWTKMKEESAGVMVENVIVLPLIFIVIYSLILTAFMIHDRCTIEAAARRGAIYASHCISDPNYASLVGQTGELDIAQETDVNQFSFSGVGNNIQAYRYIFGGSDVTDEVRREVQKIVANTRIPWIAQETVKVDCEQKNMFLYQDVTVSVTTEYHLPVFFAAFGLETDYQYTAKAKISTTDPDEFIRNADLVVDLLTQVDAALGGHISNALEKISTLGSKILDWLDVKK